MESIYSLIFITISLALFAILCLIWLVGAKFWDRLATGRKVTDPDQQHWETRFHWGTPTFRFRFWRWVFPRKFGLDKPKPNRRNVKDRWWHELFTNEFGLAIFTLAYLLFASFIFLFLLLELAVLTLLIAVVSVLRSIFIYPWQVEITEPSGTKLLLETRGLRRALRLHQEIRSAIEKGQLYSWLAAEKHQTPFTAKST